MNVERVLDRDFVRDYMTQPSIWESISDDYAHAENYDPRVYDECFLKITSGSDLVGMYRLEQLTSITVIGHAALLPEMRKEHSIAAGRAVLSYIVNDLPDRINKVVTNVPECFPNVMRYLEHFGFKKEGVNRKSYKKYGKIVDMVNYGITREEIERFLNA